MVIKVPNGFHVNPSLGWKSINGFSKTPYMANVYPMMGYIIIPILETSPLMGKK